MIEGKTTEDPGFVSQTELGYWNARRNMLYYQAVFQYVSVIGHNAQTIIDIGSAGTDYVTWFEWIEQKVQLDYKLPKKPPGVTGVEANFMTWQPPQRYDVGLCMQVLEHIDAPTTFCEKLKAVCRRLLISVPYKWLGGTPGHVHDPVDEVKLEAWMGLRPNNAQIVFEPFREGRLIAYYDLENGPNARFDKSFVATAIREHAQLRPRETIRSE